MVTKAVIQSINRSGNKCIVRMPLFENASSMSVVEAEALFSITPGLFNNLFVGDVVFVAFEENALEKPIIIGKLYRGSAFESSTQGGACIADTLRVRSAATIPSSTLYDFPSKLKNSYDNLNTPKKTADYIKWLEKFFKKLVGQLDEHFRCFKNWTQYQLRPENISIDDGDIDLNLQVDDTADRFFIEGSYCNICKNNCAKNKCRNYSKVDTNKNYPTV